MQQPSSTEIGAYYRRWSVGKTRRFILLLLLLTTSGMFLINTAAETILWRPAYAPCIQAYDDISPPSASNWRPGQPPLPWLALRMSAF